VREICELKKSFSTEIYGISKAGGDPSMTETTTRSSKLPANTPSPSNYLSTIASNTSISRRHRCLPAIVVPAAERDVHKLTFAVECRARPNLPVASYLHRTRLK
jgi:hypothetical protein